MANSKNNKIAKKAKQNTQKAPVQEEKSLAQKLNTWLWRVFIGGVIFLFLLFFITAKGWLGYMPDIKDLENPDIYTASEIISSDGVILDRFEKEKREPVEFSALPKNLINALLAKEDERFYDHAGIDKKATFRVFRYMGARGGGSTVTQQLAKLLFTQREQEEAQESGEKPKRVGKFKRGLQKIKEMIIAVQLEKLYTKEQIIAMYFNKFDFLYNAKGIQIASQVYFSKNVQDLNLSESAMFVAMLENPVQNNPKRHPEKAKERRNLVLDLMAKQEKITSAEYDATTNSDVVLKYKAVKEISSGYASYYKSELRKEVSEILDDYEKTTGKKYSLYRNGLKIYVTIDSRMQKMAEKAVEEHIKYIQKAFNLEQRGRQYAPFYAGEEGTNLSAQKIFETTMARAMHQTPRYKNWKEEGFSDTEIMKKFKEPIDLQIFTWDGEKDTLMSPWDSIRHHKQLAQAGLMSMDPNTGSIKAWVGGINWRHFQFDHVKQARRQVGSTFKPIVYATAIKQQNYTPCDYVSNERITIGGWSPRNSNGKYGGQLTLKDALAWSVNLVTIRLLQETGIEAVKQTARSLGIESPIPDNYTIALGSADITLYEMVGAFSTFANYGSYIKPELIWRIEDSNGKVLKEFKPQITEVMNEAYAYTMIELLKGVADNGTARGIRRYGVTAQIAAKTGTTNQNSDGWFVGMAPKLATAVWVGWEDRYAHFNSTSLGQGAATALPIWAKYMLAVYGNKDLGYSQDEKFVVPEGMSETCSDLLNIGGYFGNLGRLYSNEGDAGATQATTQDSPTDDASAVNQDLQSSDEVNFDK